MSAAKPIAARDFTDAGTEQFFAAGEPVDADEGAIANYRAAGLLEAAEPSPKKAGDKPAADKPAA